MPVIEDKLCMGCMSPLPESGAPCRVCGYRPDGQQDGRHLPTGAYLHGDRYLIGKLYSADPEGAWYVGSDCEEQTRIWVREYAPSSICRRDPENGALVALPSSEAQFKALMSDFEDLCRAVKRISPGEKVIPLIDIIHENNTVYAIYSYIKTITLESFLERSGGKLPWRHVKKLLMPLYHTVANIHKAGLCHRGLSPMTIQLDQQGSLWVSGFAISAVRTNKSELGAQLFAGYCAPEQYSAGGWQGTWSDVYALGAITLRVMTGKQPPAAIDRIYGDDLLDAALAGPQVTESAINAINHALAVEVEDRTQTAEALIAELLATDGSNTAVYTAPTSRRSYDDPEDAYRQELRQTVAEKERQAARPPRTDARFEATSIDLKPQRSAVSALQTRDKAAAEPEQTGSGKRKGKRAHPVLSWLLSALIATGALGFAMYYISTTYLADLLFPVESHSSSSQISAAAGVDFSQDEQMDDSVVPRFVGATAASIQYDKIPVKLEEKYNDAYDVGVVFEQQPIEGTSLDQVEEITLFVSKGVEKVLMPKVVGLTTEEAMGTLQELGIKYDVIPVYNKDYEPGLVARTNTEEGVELEKEKSTVILYTRMLNESSSEEDEEERSSSSRRSSSKKNSSSSSRKSTSDSDEPSRLFKPKET